MNTNYLEEKPARGFITDARGETRKAMAINRSEVLRKEREKVLTNLAASKDNRAKWLTALMDIDDEMEEMAENKHKISAELVR